eukprot:6186299-Pleurochrysis_carterae.AAC.2
MAQCSGALMLRAHSLTRSLTLMGAQRRPSRGAPVSHPSRTRLCAACDLAHPPTRSHRSFPSRHLSAPKVCFRRVAGARARPSDRSVATAPAAPRRATR